MLKIKSSYTLLFCLLCGINLLSAQNQEEDKLIFKALQDELNRNKNELYLPGFDKPFFISYTFNRAHSFEISASLGALISSLESPRSSVASIRLLQGNYHLNNEFKYYGQFTDIRMPCEADYNIIRRNLWMGTDIVYKNALQEYANKTAYFKENPIAKGETYPDDLSKIKPVVYLPASKPAFHFDRRKWEDNLRELSAIFKNYPDFFNSSVNLGGAEIDIYKQTTEGSRLKHSQSYVMLSVQASLRSEDGILFGDVWSTIASNPDDLPDIEELKKQIIAFSDNLIRLKNAEPISEYYSGPILFEDDACEQIFSDNLLNYNSLFAKRKLDARESGKTLEKRIGKKIIDSRLTIKNYSSLDKYKNISLLGAYEIDAEGVVPAQEITLVENGILTHLLNGRYPTKYTTESTGSSRYTLSVGRISFTTAPGTLHISAKDGLKPEKMKKALIKAAREEGLDYAYIVRKFAGQASLVYKVDVKDGKETMVRAGNFSPINLPKLKRLLAISAKEIISNYILNQEVLTSLICPSAILVEDIEINPSELRKSKEPVLLFPLKRE